MKVLVLGGGVIGVTTAWFLAEDGHEVTVVDRHAEPASETSFGNAGLISPGHALSWASPRAPLVLLRSLFDVEAPLRLRLRADRAMWRWCLGFLRNCTEGRWRVNSERKLALTRYSLHVHDALVAETGIEYHRRTGGILYIYRSLAALDDAVRHLQVLERAGLPLQVLDGAACVRMEPALAEAIPPVAGAVLCPIDESGDCCLFTRALAELCAGRGVTFRFGVAVDRLVADGARIVRIDTDAGPLTADGYVMALGSHSPIHARALGVRLPVYPLKGYSMTAAAAGAGAPAMSGVDESRLIAWSRFGERLRLTSVAEFAGYDTGLDARRFALMTRFANELFHDAADFTAAERWAGLRPMTPEGTPLFGRRGHDNLWYNTGHGSMGWSMACGSARITADLVAGREPAADLAGMVP